MTRWGMVIDLDKCTACGACVAACKTENNIPSSTPGEARQSRGMFWMEVIRFVEEEGSSAARIRYVPRPCFHCDNPPCTKVCPVRATYLPEESYKPFVRENLRREGGAQTTSSRPSKALLAHS